MQELMQDLKYLGKLFHRIPWQIAIWVIIIIVYFVVLPDNIKAICSALDHEKGMYIIVADLVVKSIIIPAFILLIRSVKHYGQYYNEMPLEEHNAIPNNQATMELQQVIREEVRKAIQAAARSINEERDT